METEKENNNNNVANNNVANPINQNKISNTTTSQNQQAYYAMQLQKESIKYANSINYTNTQTNNSQAYTEANQTLRKIAELERLRSRYLPALYISYALWFLWPISWIYALIVCCVNWHKQKKYGIGSASNFFIILILGILPIVNMFAMAYITYSLNRKAESLRKNSGYLKALPSMGR